MDKLIYTAMTGASQVLEQQASVSENLANVSTPGFRSVLNTFRAVPLLGEGLPTRTFVVDSTIGTNFSPAGLQPTGRDLDIAVNGKGWIAVQGPDGKEAYTRNGSLQIGADGMLKTSTGLNVIGSSGPINIPPTSQITFAYDGTISSIPDGSQAGGITVIDTVKLVNPPENQLERGADGLFRLKSGTAAPADPNTQIVPDNIEGSNVNTVSALVNMISLSRKFDMQMKMLTTADNDAKQASTIMGI